MQMYARAPQDQGKIDGLYQRLAAEVKNYAPDLIIVFGCDHFNGFFLNCMPSFCIGTRCEAVDDVGGTPGKLDVSPLALSFAGGLRQAGIDVAVSDNMRVDHGFSQTMDFVLDSLDAYPSLPIFMNSIAPPYLPFHRSRKIGESLATLTEQAGVDRLLVIATGGMSHHPRRYYPEPSEAETNVQHYQLNGPSKQGMNHQEWLDRLDVMHKEGAHMLIDGRRTITDIKMNPELDRRFAELLCTGPIQAMDDWDNEELIEQGGIGFMELHTWVAAAALYGTLCPEHAPKFELYSKTLEYGIGFGAVSGGFDS
ncbi:MAG: 2,3-dihydroxyphenylpropionate 1,2-dioxygenase [Parasphingorhabdus sp.]|jgi:2,3-dihydroxyphenylpropionate 1,2-dioxygenase